MKELSQNLFDIYALARPRGLGFGSRPPVGAWETPDGMNCAALTRDERDGSFGVLLMRRRSDRVWVVTEEHGIDDKDSAISRINFLLQERTAPEPIPTGETHRPLLYDLEQRTASDIFKLLSRESHRPAGWILEQLYLALPNPDLNWASDCQTSNFHTRLWEAILLGCFREQGLLVTQPHESPDFRIENLRGGHAWVEAVTANSPTPYNHVNAPQSSPPETRSEIFSGTAALRFAKTIGSKLQRRYDNLPHVTGQPFMLAMADFHAGGSMVWSREALLGYLYGMGAEVVNVDGRQEAQSTSFSHLQGPSAFPAGLFANDEHAELSAIVFSNACSIAKLNRVAVTALGAPKGLRYVRAGEFFDRTPGALKGIPFCFDIMSKEYRSLWPQGYEPWSAELEVFHNPFARYPVPHELIPEASHWFEQEGEMVCSATYEYAILRSRTRIQNEEDPIPMVDDFK